MVWAIVKFTNEDTVEAVPIAWFVNLSSECFWPPKSIKKSRIHDYIKNKQEPRSDWKVFPAILLGKYDNFNIAQRKAVKAQLTSELSSATESVKGRGYRKTKKNTKYSSDSSEDMSEDDNTYPTLASEVTPPPATPHRPKTSHAATPLSVIQPQIPIDSDFKKIVINELSLLNIKMNHLMEKVDSLMVQNIQATKVSCQTNERDELGQVLVLIPLTSEEDMYKMEDWLSEKSNQNLLIKELSRIGGGTTTQLTRKIMYRVLSNELGMVYSWEGAKKKKAFKNLALAKVILESVKLFKNTSTEMEIINTIKLWLVRSKDRHENSQKRLGEEQKDVESAEHTEPGL